MPQDIGIGIARAIRAAVSGRPGGVYLDLPAKLFGQVMDAEAGSKSLVKVIDAAPAQIPAPDAVKRALDVLKGAKRPLIILGKGAAYAQADDEIRALVEKSGIPFLPMSMAQGPAARHASAVRGRGALDGAEGRRRRDADRRAPQLAAVARQGQDLGRARPQEVHPDRHRAQGDGHQRRDRRARGRRYRLVRVSAARRRWAATGRRRRPTGPSAVSQEARRERRQDGAAADEQQRADGLPRRARRAAHRSSRSGRTPSSSTKAPTRSISRAAIIDMYQPRKRLDVGTWGVMGIGMGYAIAAAVETGKPVLAVEGDSAFGFSGMEVETICRYKLPVCVVIFNNDGIYRGTDVNTAGSDPATTVFVKGARYDKMIEAFGGVGVNATSPDELRRAVNAAMDSRQADPHQRRDRPSGRQRERPHRQPQSAKRVAGKKARSKRHERPTQQEARWAKHSKASRSSTSRTCSRARPARSCSPGSAPT